MAEPIIKVENLSKRYQIGKRESYYSLRDKISGIFDFSKGKSSDSEFWALKDVNFEVKQGESVGIIGRNGAGKSTLLKILSRITPPTTGKISMRGRVASLLEVGTGFNPELTGRENIYLNGAILGMTRAEIKRKFDEIVAFAEVEKFLDTPVKRYSSGMYMRLAFAVAAHLESEILIVDEVLAVGDAQFQKKCLGKMSDVTKNEGRTVLFVSHNIGAIKQLCPRSIIFENGRLKSFGNTHEIVEVYDHLSSESKSGVWINDKVGEMALIEKIEIVGKNNNSKFAFINSEDIVIRFGLYILENVSFLKIGFDLIKDDIVSFRSEQVDFKVKDNFEAGEKYIVECNIPGSLLNAGTYLIRPLLTIHCVKSLREYEPVLSFSVSIDSKDNLFHNVLNPDNHPGSVFPILKWSVKNV